MVEKKAEQSKSKKRLLRGKVISDVMDKTVVARVERSYQHPRLQKIIRIFKKYKVHDENEQARIGDTIEFYEGRPVSKTKHMYLHSIVGERSQQSEKGKN